MMRCLVIVLAIFIAWESSAEATTEACLVIVLSIYRGLKVPKEAATKASLCNRSFHIVVIEVPRKWLKLKYLLVCYGTCTRGIRGRLNDDGLVHCLGRSFRCPPAHQYYYEPSYTSRLQKPGPSLSSLLPHQLNLCNNPHDTLHPRFRFHRPAGLFPLVYSSYFHQPRRHMRLDRL